MTASTPYWVALNLLPLPPARLRLLHRKLGTEAALASVRAGELRRLASAPSGRSSSRAEPLSVNPRSRGPAEPGWWAHATAGSITPSLQLGSEPLGWDGARLIEEAASEIRAAGRIGIDVVAANDLRYPRLLHAIDAPPAVLYALGDLALLDCGVGARRDPGPSGAAPGWWTVGARRATDYGRVVARRLGRAIASRGAVTVSGLALGIDAESHRGALEASGPTIAVPGGGLGSACWPVANRSLADRIIRTGLIVSEFPLDTVSEKRHFPRRNRIISGLSAAIVVVEAAARSGALITARLALEQGRDVFVVPGRITDTMSAGALGLLRGGAAAPLVSIDALFEDLASVWKQRLAPAGPDGTGRAPAGGIPARGRGGSAGTPRDDGVEGLSEGEPLEPVERAMLALMRPDDPVSIDALVEASGAPAAEVLAALVGLEIRGLAVTLPGGRYLLPP